MSEEKPTGNTAEPQKIEHTFLYTLCRILFGFAFHTFCPVRYHFTERIDAMNAPYLIISNHLSAVDPFVLAVATHRYEIRFIGKRELTKNKLLAGILNALHMIPVSRHSTDMSAMRACMQVLRDGQVLGIFPEGTRHLPSLMQTVESGAALIALRANVPLLPVYIDSRVRCFHRTQAWVGEPIDFSDLRAQGVNTDTVNLLCDRIRDTYLSMQKNLSAK